MKFCSIKRGIAKKMIVIALTLINLISIFVSFDSKNSIKLKNSSKSKSTSIQKFKFYFMLKLPSVKDDEKHPLNQFNYKNVLLSTSQVVYFVSSNPNNSNPDESWNTANYIYTMLYDSVDLPCLNRSYICTHAQFVREYRPIYPEIDFNIPDEIQEKFGDSNQASDKCILIFLSPTMIMVEAAWLCHEDLKQVYIFQDKLSQIVRENNSKRFDFFIDYVSDTNKRVPGIVSLTTTKKFIFSNLQNKIIIDADLSDVKPYSISLYLKEELPWSGPFTLKPENSRCFKIQRKIEGIGDKNEYFCVFYGKSDVRMKYDLNVIQARYQAEMYTNKINLRLQERALNDSLEKMRKLASDSDIDSDTLLPVKTQVRNEYFILRHKLLCFVHLEKMKKTDFETHLSKAKEKIISSVCKSIEMCKKAILLAKDQGLLPLKGVRERFAMDIQNPFNSLIPKSSLRVVLPQGGSVGKKLLDEVAKMKNAKNLNGNLFGIDNMIPESGPGEIPNVTALKKAFNTIVVIRDYNNKKFYKLEQMNQYCRLNSRNNAFDLKRKVALLQYLGDNDNFLEYLGDMRRDVLYRDLR